MARRRAAIGLLLILLSAAAPGAQSPSLDRELRVGVFEAPPYSMKTPSGEWRGLTVDLWKEIAGDLGLRYHFEERTEDAILEGLSDGRLDLGAGPFAATMERQQVVDFSQMYLATGIALAVRQRSRMDRLLELFRILATSEAAQILLAIALLSLLFGGAIWIAERRRNPQFPARAAPGLGSGLWWASATTTTVGYGDKVPITLRGRVVAIVWMVVSLVLSVVLTASLTATLAVAQFEETRGSASLRRSTVGALEGSASADFLRKNQIRRKLYSSFPRAVDALARREVDAIMFGEAILRYYAGRGSGRGIEVLPETFMAESLAFPLPNGSALREPLNRALRRVLAGTHWRDLRDKYITSETAAGSR
ncbi:MAG TPA: transporter substrate-binding domain-containing protein [Thermoanaerobaculia bacterium]|jgi:ABC-type amino acid transport substrate-binding protein